MTNSAWIWIKQHTIARAGKSGVVDYVAQPPGYRSCSGAAGSVADDGLKPVFN